MAKQKSSAPPSTVEARKAVQAENEAAVNEERARLVAEEQQRQKDVAAEHEARRAADLKARQ